MIWFSRTSVSSTLRDCPSSGASCHFWERSRFYGDSMPPYDPVASFVPSINVSLIIAVFEIVGAAAITSKQSLNPRESSNTIFSVDTYRRDIFDSVSESSQ